MSFEVFGPVDPMLSPDWAKGDGLLPVIVQDAGTLRVLMLGYMNAEALAETRRSGRVTFYSRSKHRLWTKGESSGNRLDVVDIKLDCDRDTLLVDILIPNRLAWAEKAHLRALQNQPRRPFLNAQVIADRPYSTHAIRQPDGTVVIRDVPTVLSTLNQSIEQRRRSIHDVRLKAEGWEVLETQEIERFEAKCRTFVQTSVPPIYQDRVRVVRWDGH